MGKTGAMIIPENIECEGFLVKGGGQDGNKKKKVRYFTMGDGKIAYFDAKTKEKADAKHCKGIFPIDQDSSVRDGGKVDGVDAIWSLYGGRNLVKKEGGGGRGGGGMRHEGETLSLYGALSS